MKLKESKKELLEEEIKTVKETDLEKDDDAVAVSISEFTSGLNFEHSMEKYKDNMSTAITFLLCGIGGIVVLVLNWFGIIKLIAGKDLEAIVIYVALLILFVIFLGIGIYSIKVANKVKTKIKSEVNYTDEIRDWVADNISPEDVDASYIDNGLPIEIKYFERNSYITKAIKEQFPDAPTDLVESICDEFIEEKFHAVELALAEENMLDDEDYDDEDVEDVDYDSDEDEDDED